MNRIPFRSLEFSIWKTITIGGTSPQELTLALEKQHQLTDRARQAILHPSFKVEQTKQELSLVRIDERQISFAGACDVDVFNKSWCLGFSALLADHYQLELCPPEAGPHLRLQYPNQQDEEELYIAMEPVPDSVDSTEKGVFFVGHSDENDERELSFVSATENHFSGSFGTKDDSPLIAYVFVVKKVPPLRIQINWAP